MIFSPSEIRTLIHAATKHTGTPVHDEDLQQEVALRAVEAFRRLREVTHPRALLMKIVHDTVRDHWRRKRSSQEFADVDERLMSHMPAFESNLDRQREFEVLRGALERMPARKRDLLELFYVQDLSIGEIADLQRRSVSAVKMDLARSRRFLARIFYSLSNQKQQRRVIVRNVD
jgi:RNA polymerase sigma factor (sigma-70 family)